MFPQMRLLILNDMLELLNVYKVFFKKGEPIVVAASTLLEVCERLYQLHKWDPLEDPVIKIEYSESQIYV